MRKPKFFFITALWGVLGIALVSWAQTGYRIEEERRVTSSSETDVSVVKVYGPDALTELTRRAIQEQRPDVAVETYYKPLKNKVWIEGTTGADYMSLSPKRVGRLQAAKAKGGSVYSALCTEQKGVIRKTVGIERDWVRVERKEVRTRCYVRSVCAPPPAILFPVVNVGFVVGGAPRFYGYRAYGVWGERRYYDYRVRRGYRSFHKGYGGHHASRAFHRGRK